MLHSLRLRLLLTMVAVAAVTAGSVALLARQFTVAEFQRYLRLASARSQLVGELFSAASRLPDQDAAARNQAVRQLSERAGTRVVLAEADGVIVADSAGTGIGRLADELGLDEAVVVRLERSSDGQGADVQLWTPRSFGGPQVAAVQLQDEPVVGMPLPIAAPQGNASGEPQGALTGPGQVMAEVAPAAITGDTLVFFYTEAITRALTAGAPGVQLASGPVAMRWAMPAGTDPIEAGFISGVNRSLGFALVVAGLAALLLTAALSRRIIRPVEELRAAAEAMATGDLSRRVAVRANDEIAALARAFNSMAAALQRAESLRRSMVSDVAHELRTPLTNIRGYLEALRDGVARPDERTLASLHEEALLLNRLVDDLQDLALAEAGQLRLRREPANLGAVAEGAVAVVRPRLEAKCVGCELLVAPGLPLADVDAERVGQVLRNLLNNALTHTPPGGAVTVEVRLAPGDGPPMLAVTVADTGCGIAPAELPLIFERFYRADRSRARATGGAGLGLTIVRQLVEAHGGAVSVASAPDEGARFTFTVPGVVSDLAPLVLP